MSHYSPKLSELDIHDFAPPSPPEKPLLLMSPFLFPRPQFCQTEVFQRVFVEGHAAGGQGHKGRRRC
jgi:hypothetical protein